jgi:hypothetical protein
MDTIEDPPILPRNLPPESQGTFLEALPMLQGLQEHTHGRKGQQLEGRMPNDAVVFAGEPVIISPYYMNRYDPKETGVWAITVGSLTMRIKTMFGPDGPSPTFQVRDEEKHYHNANPDEIRDVMTLLGYISTHLEQAA